MLHIRQPIAARRNLPLNDGRPGMMKRIGRPSKGGAHKVTIKGVEYWYAWKGAGAPPLQSQPGTRAFAAELKRLRGERPPSPTLPVKATKPAMLGDVIDG